MNFKVDENLFAFANGRWKRGFYQNVVVVGGEVNQPTRLGPPHIISAATNQPYLPPYAEQLVLCSSGAFYTANNMVNSLPEAEAIEYLN